MTAILGSMQLNGAPALPPFPAVPVAAPPWAGYHSTLATLKNVEDRAKPSGELYPPGQNPIFNDPWATVPQPVLPAPNTPQYGGPWTGGLDQMQMPSRLISFSGWAQAEICSREDPRMTFAESVHRAQTGAPWYFVRVDGWTLKFFSQTNMLNPHAIQLTTHRPETSLDVRFARRVESARQANAAVPFVVVVLFQTGRFIFSVRGEAEAQQWCQVIQSLIGEFQIVCQRRMNNARQIASELNSVNNGTFIVKYDAAKSQQGTSDHSVSPERQSQLRTLWGKCVKAAFYGQPVDNLVWEGIFNVYDVNGDGDLSVGEIQLMAKDLFVVRRRELEVALDRQNHTTLNENKLLLDCKRQVTEQWNTVGMIGQRLMQDYDAKLSKEGFDSRCIALHSQLDVDASGHVSLSEFCAGAPLVLLPQRELKVEAQFYHVCSKAIQRTRKAELWIKHAAGEYDDDNDEGICVQQ